MVDALTKDQLAEFREAFDLFDRDHDGCVHTADLGTLMRSLGAAPTMVDLQTYERRWRDDGGLVDFNGFCTAMVEKMQEPITDDYIKNAFEFLDKDNTGFVEDQDIRHVMTTIGDKLTPEEVDEMFRDADVEGDRISYDEFRRMMSK